MPLIVEPVVLADFDTLLSYGLSDKGDLTAQPTIWVWPAATPGERKARNDWSVAQDRQYFLTRPTIKFIKVIDTDADNEILAIARWRCFPDGYAWNPYDTARELDAFSTTSVVDSTKLPIAMNFPAHKLLLDNTIFSGHAKWVPPIPVWSRYIVTP